jgi:hypothetical protein
MSVCWECCVLSVTGLCCDGLITRPEESYRLWRVVVCDLETSWKRRLWTTVACCAKTKKGLDICRSRWLCSLRRGSAAALWLGLRVRILPGTWMMSVCCVCCVLSEVSTTGWSLVQRIPTKCGVSECDREASIMRRAWLLRHEEESQFLTLYFLTYNQIFSRLYPISS